MSACTYTPGTWTAVVCERLVALVEPGAGEARVAGLWDAAASGGGVHEALVTLSEDGPDDLPSFALVTLSHSGLLHAALRGEVEALIGSGKRAVRSGGTSAWSEVTAHDVPEVTLRAVGAAADGSPLPLLAGAVLAGQVRVGAELWGPAGFGDGVDVVPALEDHEGLTIVSGDLARLRAAGAVPAGSPPAPTRPVAPVPVARVVLSTGLVVPLDRTVLLGRAPQVGRVAARELPRLVTVPSPQQDVSRTHAQVRQEGEHVVVTDLESLNGTRVARPGGSVRRLRPGEPTVVAPAEIVDLGDGVTFTVETDA